MSETVECHSEYDYAERPVAVHWQGERLAVEEILNRWRDPHGIGFCVRTANGQAFDLYYDLLAGAWRISENEIFNRQDRQEHREAREGYKR